MVAMVVVVVVRVVGLESCWWVLYYVWSGRYRKEVANEICECNLVTPSGDSFN